jgi:cytochrome c oxidase assembly protein Cox11
VGEGKHIFIENNIPGYIYTVCRNMKTLVTFVKRAISQKNTLFRSKLKFAIIVWAKVWPASTAKHFKKCVVWCFTEKTLVDNEKGN